ncbi:SOS response-associated peptidase [Bizionia gelidisalsuginis]|uniref:SOS response-associated peptidase n=1 Tax=Bizionia gelidisalsuginis TaxID=291188 RepID=A0ABY3M7J5_9FLAO|nr:SOS response-associated peptidase family protein [Bizionia gelidisalsuginis]TYC09165.1 SOS response-associated peptidase [Bizionia gelidisalsuginis]
MLVTGIVATYLNEGVLQRILIQAKDTKPFTLAGIYNVTNDGFLTVSIINTLKKESITGNKSIPLKMPVIIREAQREDWLGLNTEMKTIKIIVKSANELRLYTIKTT